MSAMATELELAAEELSALARELAPQTERDRRLPEPLLGRLRASGVMRAGAPAELGAAQAPPDVTLRCAETIARGDASAGWCVSIAATSSLLSAYLAPHAAAEIFGPAEMIAAGVWAPSGTAVPEPGGWRVTGRWSFCSGISHSEILFAGALVDRGAEPSLLVVGIPTEELEIFDTWHTNGLCGTGSHDAAAAEVFVPAERTLRLLGGSPAVDAPLYRFPIFGFFALSIAAAALGNARGAIDDLIAFAAVKVSQGSRRTLAERSSTQAAVAAAEASLRAARALFYEATADAWAEAQDREPVSLAARAGLRLAATHGVRTAADVSRAMYDLGGGAAIYADSPLQRRMRDALTATAHFQVNPASWELPGRLLLGQPAQTAML
jgi:alkylation response protein AidB-like acyl-CoA dehydrogenase